MQKEGIIHKISISLLPQRIMLNHNDNNNNNNNNNGNNNSDCEMDRLGSFIVTDSGFTVQVINESLKQEKKRNFFI